MKYLLITILACSLTSTCSAWQTFDDYTKNCSEDQKIEVIRKEPGKFYLSANYEGKGTSIHGLNVTDKTMVCLRRTDDKIDLKLSIFEKVSNEECEIYIKFLDSDGYEIDEVKIANVGRGYTGNLYKSYGPHWSGFSKAYSYEVHLRG